MNAPACHQSSEALPELAFAAPLGRRAKGSLLSCVSGATTALLALSTTAAFAADPLPVATPLPDVGLSVLRLFGALAIVLAVFFGGVWLFRNWQRLVVQNGRAPKLNVMEVRPLGNRHALYVVAYEDQRMLLSSGPAGVTFLSHLPPGEAGAAQPEATPNVTTIPFAQTLHQLLNRK